MATLQITDIADVAATTLAELGKFKFTQNASDLQDHIAMREILQRHRTTFDSGKTLDFNVMVQSSGAARNNGLYEVDQVDVADVMTTGSIPWRHTETKMAIEAHEVDVNSGAARIVDLTTVRRVDALTSLYDKMETNFWGIPASGDVTTPYGIDYWLTKSATEGFNGTDHANFSAGKAGLSSSTYSRWKNYTARYVNVTKTDLIRKWRKAAVFTKFKNPVQAASYSTGARHGYYTNYDVQGILEEVLEAQNDNLGNDIASKDGMVRFRGVPVTWVPQLENDAQDPVYGIDWGDFKATFLKGWFMKQTGPKVAPNQRHVVRTFWDNSYNFRATDLRKHFIINIA